MPTAMLPDPDPTSAPVLPAGPALPRRLRAAMVANAFAGAQRARAEQSKTVAPSGTAVPAEFFVPAEFVEETDTTEYTGRHHVGTPATDDLPSFRGVL